MFTITANFKHASDNINGVPFDLIAGQRVAKGVSREKAKLFLDVPGFTITGDKKGADGAAEAPAAPAAPEAGTADAQLDKAAAGGTVGGDVPPAPAPRASARAPKAKITES